MSHYVYRTTIVITSQVLLDALQESESTIHSALGLIVRVLFAEGCADRALAIINRYKTEGKLLKTVRELDESNGITLITARYFGTLADAEAFAASFAAIKAENEQFRRENNMLGWIITNHSMAECTDAEFHSTVKPEYFDPAMVGERGRLSTDQ